ncbi:MAG: hypothetical protein KDK25_01065 [Leptospiraceae bacterium]|nr:hypothetical protein [Leptospiraceae bacterium]MCB1168889.1 hypothetical protein [Leptospiraceae bacterium]
MSSFRRRLIALSATTAALLCSPLISAPMDRFQTVAESDAIGPLYRNPSNVVNVPLVLPMEADLFRPAWDGGGRDLKLTTLKPGQNPAYRRSNRYLALDDESGSFYMQFRESRLYQRSVLELSLYDPRRAYTRSSVREMDLTLLYKKSRFSFLFDVGHEESLALNRRDLEERVSAGLSLGYGLGARSPVSVLVGLQSRNQIVDPFRENQIIGAQYGTLFFTPGIQIATSTMMLEAVLEVPVHTYDLRPEQNPGGATPIDSDLRARFGMRYMIQ